MKDQSLKTHVKQRVIGLGQAGKEVKTCGGLTDLEECDWRFR